LLEKHGLCFTQVLQGTSLKTIIFHIESGEQIESIIDIPQNVELKGMNAFQVLGSAITYLRRYSLSSALGLITDVDNDASGEQKKSVPTKTATPSDKPEPEKWLNHLYKDGNITKEYLNILDGMKKGTVNSVADVRKYYKVSKEVAVVLEQDLAIQKELNGQL
jgi:hypothetical protein